MTGDPPVVVPPPLPLYTFPRAQTPDAPPMTGFAHSLPVVRHRTRGAAARRGLALREPLQDPRRGLLLAHWFGVRDREETDLYAAKAERELKRRQAEMAALQLSHLQLSAAATAQAGGAGSAAASGDEGGLAVEGVGVDGANQGGGGDGAGGGGAGDPAQRTASAVAAFLSSARDDREARRRGSEGCAGGGCGGDEKEPPTRRLVYDTADRDGINVDRRDGDVEFDSWFDRGAGNGSFDVASTWVSSERCPRGTHGTRCVPPER